MRAKKGLPVFVVLKKEPWLDFRDLGKTFEMRRAEGKWNPLYLRKGKQVRLGCGYSKKNDKKRNLHGVIGKVVSGSLQKIFGEIDFKEIEPRAKTVREAKLENLRVLGRARKYIAFQIVRAGKKPAINRGH
ncbi:MAG: hypothetical protein Q8P49_02550 [Candidatus Liptonbacteria bacterium]|nr:hypothetical protein [Candidatus Liptonbacteria bacterium]